VDGVRTPFMTSSSLFTDLMAVDLGNLAMKGLVEKTGLGPKDPDAIYYGTVIQEVGTSNIARECSLLTGFSDKIPAHTVTMACISSNAAVHTAANLIMTKQAGTVLAGGVETMSDVPIRFSRPLRKKFLKLGKAKGLMAQIKLFSDTKAADLAPVAPAIKGFSTGETMGNSSDRLSAKFGVKRSEMDEYAVNSHKKAAAAHAAGKLDHEIVAVMGTKMDNGIRGDVKLEKLASMKPAFIKPHGTHTAGNSSFLTDGASVVLLMDKEKALANGYKPKAYLRDTVFTASDPGEELLLGPAYSISKLLARNNLTIADVDVWEIHEAFAGQILANLNALDMDSFAKSVGRSSKVGRVPMEKINTLGGALAIGHPFGATGTRLLTTASNRLNAEGKRFAVISACADSGLGVAQLIENAQ
jgi:acetyl-CoA acyltransferase